MHDWSNGFPVQVGGYVLGLSEASPETAGYWEGVARDELRVKQCGQCGTFLHPRRIVCSGCGSSALAWKKSPGRGTIYTYSCVHRAPRPEFKDSLPYFVGIIELEEAVYLFSRVFAKAHAAVQIGAPVQVEFRRLETGEKLPVFAVVAE